MPQPPGKPLELLFFLLIRPLELILLQLFGTNWFSFPNLFPGTASVVQSGTKSCIIFLILFELLIKLGFRSGFQNIGETSLYFYFGKRKSSVSFTYIDTLTNDSKIEGVFQYPFSNLNTYPRILYFQA